MPLTILHFADLYLDTPFTNPALPPEVGSVCRQAIRRALSGLVDTAREEKVTAVTVAGNLFTSVSLHPETLEFLHGELARLGSIPVYIAPGKTDRVSRSSPYLLWHWPPNVTVFKEPTFTQIPLSEGVRLWGAAVTSQGQPADSLASLRVGDPGVHLLLAQLPADDDSGTAAGASAIDVAALERSGLRLALLGGSYDRRMPSRHRPLRVYPGSPESVGFQCTGAGGGVLVRIDDATVDLQPVPTRRLRFAAVEIDLSELPELSMLSQRVQEEMEPSRETILQIRLVGRISPVLFTELPALAEQLSAKYLHIDLRVETRPHFEIDSLAAQPTVRGRFVRRLLDQRQGSGSAQRRVIDEALDAGLLALENLEVPCR